MAVPHPPDAPSVGTQRPGATHAAYRDYRRRQALRLLSLMPEGAVRPLYRRARDESGDRSPVADPMALLLEFCQELLPLPPFEVWLADRSAHPSAYLDDAPHAGGAAAPAAPVTVERRSFDVDGVTWSAALDVRHDGGVWRGHITFRTVAGGHRAHATGEIFREGDARAVRERFLAFDDRTVRAFLRSALP